MHFLIDGDSDEPLLSSDDGKDDAIKEWNKETKKIDFPEVGAYPRILAFPTTKHWQRERNHVTKEWFESEIKTTDELKTE